MKAKNKPGTKIGHDSFRLYPLNHAQAMRVLHTLASKNEEFAMEVVKESAKEFSSVDIDEVAGAVTYSLTSITDEDCMAGAGRQRYGGYRDMGDVAYDLFCEKFSSFTYQIDLFYKNGVYAAEIEYIKGAILGLYQFSLEGTEDYYVYVEECPTDFTSDLINAYKKRHPESPDAIQAIHDFIKQKCPKWDSLEF